jgi:hypothetical protein
MNCPHTCGVVMNVRPNSFSMHKRHGTIQLELETRPPVSKVSRFLTYERDIMMVAWWSLSIILHMLSIQWAPHLNVGNSAWKVLVWHPHTRFPKNRPQTRWGSHAERCSPDRKIKTLRISQPSMGGFMFCHEEKVMFTQIRARFWGWTQVEPRDLVSNRVPNFNSKSVNTKITKHGYQHMYTSMYAKFQTMKPQHYPVGYVYRSKKCRLNSSQHLRSV